MIYLQTKMKITWITAIAIVTERFTVVGNCWNYKFQGRETAIFIQ